MIDRYFDVNEKKSNTYISLNHYWRKAQFESRSKKCSYDREKLKAALEYLLFNSYVKFGPYVFRQIKDSPMGGNACPLKEDFFFFFANLEFRYMDKLLSSKTSDNLRLAKNLSYNSRYIDDIAVCNMNDMNNFYNVL